VVRVIREYLTGFKAMHYRVETLLAAEDGSTALCRWNLTAYHLGAFMGRPGTGDALRIQGMTAFEFKAHGSARRISRIDSFRESLQQDRAGVGIDPYAL